MITSIDQHNRAGHRIVEGMRVRNVLVLVGCLAVLGFAGHFAVAALDSSGADAPRLYRTTVRVTADDANGLAQLTTLGPVRVGGAAGRVLPAGTVINTTGDALSAAMATNPAPTTLAAGAANPPQGGAPGPAAGSTLVCDLRVGWADGGNVIDVVNCAGAAASP